MTRLLACFFGLRSAAAACPHRPGPLEAIARSRAHAHDDFAALLRIL